jgi:hypothetical protein
MATSEVKHLIETSEPLQSLLSKIPDAKDQKALKNSLERKIRHKITKKIMDKTKKIITKGLLQKKPIKDSIKILTDVVSKTANADKILKPISAQKPTKTAAKKLVKKILRKIDKTQIEAAKKSVQKIVANKVAKTGKTLQKDVKKVGEDMVKVLEKRAKKDKLKSVIGMGRVTMLAQVTALKGGNVLALMNTGGPGKNLARCAGASCVDGLDMTPTVRPEPFVTITPETNRVFVPKPTVIPAPVMDDRK